MSRSVLRSFAVLAALSASGCGMHVLVDPRVPSPDAVTRPSLAQMMRTAQAPTIVLRVPAPQAQVSQSQGGQGDLHQAYNVIEKELVRAGFVVRDRGLLEEILRSSQNLDYGVIQERIGAQLILEIVSIAPHNYSNNRYTRRKDGRAGVLEIGDFYLLGWQFQCKVVMVSTGEIGGIYTIDVAPERNEFFVKGNNVQTTGHGALDPFTPGYILQLETAAPRFVHKLLEQLRSHAGSWAPVYSALSASH